ncbi:HAMP domain-containing hybrid sensor histidine kinase/response regulator, partial [Desulfamplus magnetovallimortis]|uniref:HAMP domain-containing hybrid sensor histidine kinase/response regulator n=1 Tax=Desulfamplus magnetovallimortis TaxID=1246637 RepID=UPI0016491E17
MRIRNKISILVFFLLLLLSVLGLYSINVSSNALEISYGRNMVRMAQVMHDQIVNILSFKVESLQTIALRPEIMEYLDDSNRRFDSMITPHDYIRDNDILWRKTTTSLQHGTGAGDITRLMEIWRVNPVLFWDTLALPPQEKGELAVDNIIPLIARLSNNSVSMLLRELFIYFYERNRGQSIFSEIFLTNRYGAVVAMSNIVEDYDQSDEQWWQQAMSNGLYISEVQHDASVQGYGMTVAVRLDEPDNKPVGVVKSVISSHWILREVKSITRMHQYTDIKVATVSGKLIYSSKPFNFLEDVSERPFFKTSISPEGFTIVREGAKDKIYASASLSKNGEDQSLFPVNASKHSLNKLDWVLFMGHQVEDVLAPIYQLQKRMLMVYSAVILLSLIVAFFFGRRLARAISSVRDAAVDVTKGDLSRRIDLVQNRRDELGELAESFNIMTSRLETSYNALEQEIRIRKEAEKAADAANMAKSNFLANMSHELRTPLNAIIGFSQLMKNDTNSTSEQKERTGIILKSGMHLLVLINDILEVSKIEAGRLEIEISTFDLHQLINDVISMIEPRFANTELQLVKDIDPEIPVWFKGDQQKIKQVLINLFGNAVKFTKEGSVTLRVVCGQFFCFSPEISGESGKSNVSEIWSEESEKRDLPETRNESERWNDSDIRSKSGVSNESEMSMFITFEVSDTGVGIAPEEKSKLFKKFSQTNTGIKSGEGTGLGLSISHEYVRLMEGELTVESDVGKGSTFRFTIPLQPVAVDESLGSSRQNSTLRVSTIAPGQKHFRILVVEDNAENRNLLLQLLLDAGFQVRSAENGLKGVELFESWHPHLIWMDIRMPVMDGYEASRRIKESDNGKNVVIIALTASVFEEQKHKILSAGCDDFIRKPFLTEDIFDAISRHLGVRYLYEDSSHTQGESILRVHHHDLADDAESLSNHPENGLKKLPQEIVDTLKQAIVALDIESIDDAINEIEKTDKSIAYKLSTLASNF